MRINPDSIPRNLKRAAIRANLATEISDIAGRSLRSGLVTQASLDGMSPLAVMEVTGHRTMAVVKRYFRAQLAGGRSAAGTLRNFVIESPALAPTVAPRRTRQGYKKSIWRREKESHAEPLSRWVPAIF